MTSETVTVKTAERLFFIGLLLSAGTLLVLSLFSHLDVLDEETRKYVAENSSMLGIFGAAFFCVCNLKSWRLFFEGLFGSTSTLTNISVRTRVARLLGGLALKSLALLVALLVFLFAGKGGRLSFLLVFTLFIFFGMTLTAAAHLLDRRGTKFAAKK